MQKYQEWKHQWSFHLCNFQWFASSIHWSPALIGLGGCLAGSLANLIRHRFRKRAQWMRGEKPETCLKIHKYRHLANDFHFIPIATETLRTFGPEAIKFLEDLGHKLDLINDEKRSKSFLFQSIGISIQKSNAASILGTKGIYGKLEELSYYNNCRRANSASFNLSIQFCLYYLP